ncbi:MAG: M20 family metallopeptidase [Armatimonadota bacterium]
MPDYDDAIINYLNDQAGEMAEALARLVRISTVNPYSGDPSPAGEAAGQRYLEGLMREIGGETSFLPVPADIYPRAGILGPRERSWAGRENLVGQFTFGDEGGETIVLNGHMDTIGVSDFEGEPFTGRIDGDLIHGRGTSDCKCGLIAGLFALKALRALQIPLRCRVLFQSVVDEECNGGGAGTLACCLAGVTGRYCLALDGSSGLLYTGCQGVATVEITVRGRAGHGSLGGVSAVDKLLLVHGALERLKAERAETRPGFAVNVGALRAGLAPWVVPNLGWLTANINYAREEMTDQPGNHGAVVRERLEALVAEISREDPWLRDHAPELVWVKDLPPFASDDAGHPVDAAVLAAAAEEALTKVTGALPKRADLPAWADAAHLARAGRMPVAGMGAGEPGASHTATEYNRLSNIRRAAAAVALTLARLDVQ